MEARRNWTRGELIVAFYAYCVTPFGKVHNRNPEIVGVAERLGRTPSALAMKMVNFASFDPVHQSRHVKGLGNASRGDRAIWEDYHGRWDALLDAYQGEVARFGLGEVEGDAETGAGRETEVLREVKVRVAQGFFRRAVLASYDFHCAICQLNNPRLLNAGHIIPWAVDETLRADPRNGLSLCALHDRAFDRGMITVDSAMRLVLSGELKKRPVGGGSLVYKAAFEDLEGERIMSPGRFGPLEAALAYHREEIFERKAGFCDGE